MAMGKKEQFPTLTEQCLRFFFLTLLILINSTIFLGELFQKTVLRIIRFFISIALSIYVNTSQILKNSASSINTATGKFSVKYKAAESIFKQKLSQITHGLGSISIKSPPVKAYSIEKKAIKTKQSTSKRSKVPRSEPNTLFLFFHQVGRLIHNTYEQVFRFTSTAILVLQVFSIAFTKIADRVSANFLSGFKRGLKLFYLSFTTSFKFFLAGFVVCLITIFAVESYHFIKSLPSPKNIGKVNFPLSTHIFDKQGKLLYEIYRDENRTPVQLETLPIHVSQAVISIEDKNYRSHNGISVVSGLLRAAKDTVKTNSLQGGSTITQQLVKSALLTPERTIERKFKEIILAIWTEQMYDKDQILEMYLNQVSFGGSSYGVEEASKAYFGKSAKSLTVPEAALLAGLPQAPSLYSPFFNPEAALYRRNDVLQRMYEQRFINKQQRDQALATPVRVVPPKTNIKAPHFVFYAKQSLEEDYGIKQVEEGGLRVRTTLDLEIQREAETILKEELEKVTNLNITNGAILVTDPNNGDILAMVGSVDYFSQPDGAFNVTTALRQPGSSIKPLLYALGLERGYTAATLIADAPIVFGTPGGEAYRPVNYDGTFRGNVTFRAALANSYNIPAVKILNTMGVQAFVDHARKMGIDTWEDSSRFGLSLSLGGGEVTMIDMNEAFGVFASGGYRTEPRAIVKLENSNRDIVGEAEPDREKVMDTAITYVMSDIMSDNNARVPAFGRGSALEIPGYKVAVKTGTTDSKKDNWTCGYTSEFVTCVWVGNNNNVPMNQALTSGVTGAAPIWSRVMKYLVTEKSKLGTTMTFTKPEDISEKNCNGKKEFFVRGTEGSVFCQPAILKPGEKKIISDQNAGQIINNGVVNPVVPVNPVNNNETPQNVQNPNFQNPVRN